jgi:hypothetical protein
MHPLFNELLCSLLQNRSIIPLTHFLTGMAHKKFTGNFIDEYTGPALECKSQRVRCNPLCNAVFSENPAESLVNAIFIYGRTSFQKKEIAVVCEADIIPENTHSLFGDDCHTGFPEYVNIDFAFFEIS